RRERKPRIARWSILGQFREPTYSEKLRRAPAYALIVCADVLRSRSERRNCRMDLPTTVGFTGLARSLRIPPRTPASLPREFMPLSWLADDASDRRSSADQAQRECKS